MTEQENKSIRRRFGEEVWNLGNLAMVEQLTTPGVVFHMGLVPGGKLTGPAQFASFVAMQRAAFSELVFTIEDLLGEDDKVATRWTIAGTHTSEFMGVPASNLRVSLAATDITRFENGKIAESWITSDVLGLLRQLGASPSSALGHARS